MRKFKLLILTDHSNHSAENSLYSLALAMRKNVSCENVDIASRGNNENDIFFEKQE